jgi:hypothetical protein
MLPGGQGRAARQGCAACLQAAAFDAIAATLPVGSVAFERDTGDKGERHIWLAAEIVNKLRRLRGSGESYSDVILRLSAQD